MKKILFAFVSLLVAAGVQAFACASPKYLTYEQFGAKGDGVADDFPAIIATHAAANIKGLPVKAAGGKTYYIGNTTGTAVIRTDVDFGTARFIIDDSHVSLEDREDYIFRIESPFEPFDIDGIGSLKRDQTNIGKSLIALREDYGSSWEGEVIVRNCKLIVPEGAKNVSILRGSNAGEHDFGYTCYLPEIIDIENLVIDDSRVSEQDYQGPMILGKFKRNYGKGVINIRNVEVASGKPLEISQEPKMFSDYTVTVSR